MITSRHPPMEADPKILAKLRKIASVEGRHFQAVLDEAMRDYI